MIQDGQIGHDTSEPFTKTGKQLNDGGAVRQGQASRNANFFSVHLGRAFEGLFE